MYQFFFNTFLKRIDPESAHHLGVFALKAMRWMGLMPRRRAATTVEVAGIEFRNRIGMAAGFDKNAKLVYELGLLGFGHVEIGTVTGQPQPGNPKPRLFRLPAYRALINRMGFNNDGADVVAERLKRLRAKHSGPGRLPAIGVNIGKTKVVDLADAAADYAYSAERLAPFADYIAVNVSSPNTPGLRDLQQVEVLRPILEVVVAKSMGLPVFVKIAPDLADEDVVAVAKLATEVGLAGVIATNTTISRDAVSGENAAEQGGLSGAPVAERSLELLSLLRRQLPQRMAVISVGGIETATDVAQRLALGADLVQGYTGFIYRGPFWASELTRGESLGS
jgi:dihydroorotate dehydrogenase